MNSLNEHLRAGAFHDRLPFHASCPICCDRRLHGRLAPAPLVPIKTQATILAGLVAASSALPPTAALAVEADRTTDGTAPVSQTAPADKAASSDFDPGGGDTSLPEQAPAAPTPAGDAVGDDADSVDAAPTGDAADPVVDDGAASDVSQAAPVTAPAVTAPAPSGPAPAAAAPVPKASPVSASESAPQSGTAVPAREDAVAAKTKKARKTEAKTRHAARAGEIAAVAATTTAQPSSSTAAAAPAAVASAHARRVSVSGSVHVVRPGESLWAIADAMLGGDGSTAEIAREVNRLWQLNSSRIATGDPDLLVVGTRLALR